jgi:hypothetical protein
MFSLTQVINLLLGKVTFHAIIPPEFMSGTRGQKVVLYLGSILYVNSTHFQLCFLFFTFPICINYSEHILSSVGINTFPYVTMFRTVSRKQQKTRYKQKLINIQANCCSLRI